MRIIASILISCCFATGCALAPGNVAQAHPMPDGEELGADIKVTQTSPVNAVISVKPKIRFSRIEIGLGRNAVGGAKTVCVFESVAPGRTHSCQLTGDVVSTDTGLVLTVSGIQSSGTISFKAFTIPNPRYDRSADREIQQRLSRGEQTLIVEPEPR